MEMFLEFWESWLVVITVLVTLGVTVYAFLSHEKSTTAAMVYQVVTVMSFILALPALLIGPILGPILDIELFQITDDSIRIGILWLNVFGGLVALFTFLLSIFGIGQDPSAATQGPGFGGGLHNQPINSSRYSSIASQSAQGLSGPHTPQGASGAYTARATGPQTAPATGPQTARGTGGPNIDSTLEDPPSHVDGQTRFGRVATSAQAVARSAHAAAPAAQAVASFDDQANKTLLLDRSQKSSQYFAWLIELNGPRIGHVHSLSRNRNVIGRGSGSQLILQDQAVSTQHAVMLRDEEQKVFVLHDLGSSNGTYLHGQRLNGPQPLKDKDRIKLGQTYLHFMEIRLDEVLQKKADSAESGAPPSAPIKDARETVIFPSSQTIKFDKNP